MHKYKYLLEVCRGNWVDLKIKWLLLPYKEFIIFGFYILVIVSEFIIMYLINLRQSDIFKSVLAVERKKFSQSTSSSGTTLLILNLSYRCSPIRFPCGKSSVPFKWKASCARDAVGTFWCREKPLDPVGNRTPDRPPRCIVIISTTLFQFLCMQLLKKKKLH